MYAPCTYHPDYPLFLQSMDNGKNTRQIQVGKQDDWYLTFLIVQTVDSIEPLALNEKKADPIDDCDNLKRLWCWSHNFNFRNELLFACRIPVFGGFLNRILSRLANYFLWHWRMHSSQFIFDGPRKTIGNGSGVNPFYVRCRGSFFCRTVAYRAFNYVYWYDFKSG